MVWNGGVAVWPLGEVTANPWWGSWDPDRWVQSRSIQLRSTNTWRELLLFIDIT
jgi:hypothetical protein